MCLCRYRDAEEEVNLADQESKNLEKLRQNIEKRKNAFINRKNIEVTTQKTEPVKLPEPTVSVEIQKSDDEPIKILKSEELKIKETTKLSTKFQDFKVLGVNDFEKKAKVSITTTTILPCLYS